MKGTVIIPGFGPMRDAAAAQSEKIRSLLGPGFEVLTPDGATVAEARNRGLDAARGEWIFWVDADDVAGEEWAALARETADGEKSDITVFDAMIEEPGRRRPLSWGVLPQDATPRKALRDCLSGALYSHLHTKAFRAELWRGMRFDPALERMEDYQILPHVLAHARTLRYRPQCVYGYVVRQGSLAHGADFAALASATLAAARRRESEWAQTEFAADARAGAADAALALWESRCSARAAGDAADRELAAFIRERAGLLFRAGAGWKWRARLAFALAGMRRARCAISRIAALSRGWK